MNYRLCLSYKNGEFHFHDFHSKTEAESFAISKLDDSLVSWEVREI